MSKAKAFKEITSRLSELTRPELRELKAIIETMLWLEEEKEMPELIKAAKRELNKQGPSGHIELKKIRGYGPYKYLRYWSGKRLKSVYIGKAKK